MGPHGIMYLVVKKSKRVGPLGEQIPWSKPRHEMSEEKEKPLEVSQEDMHLINSLRGTRVSIDVTRPKMSIFKRKEKS